MSDKRHSRVNWPVVLVLLTIIAYGGAYCALVSPVSKRDDYIEHLLMLPGIGTIHMPHFAADKQLDGALRIAFIPAFLLDLFVRPHLWRP